MEETLAIPNTLPRSLESLTYVDQLFFYQKVQPLACFSSGPRNNFILRNGLGQYLFFVRQSSDCAQSCFWSTSPAVFFEIVDIYENEVIYVTYPLSCGLKTIQVSTPPGVVLGTVQRQRSFYRRNFLVKDVAGNTILHIMGPAPFSVGCCNDTIYEVLSADGTMLLGSITQFYLGFSGSLFTGVDRYEINFSMGLDVRMKAMLLSACLLIDRLRRRY